MKKIIILLFIALALIQWAVPISMIVGHENVLAKGKEFRFLTEPIDPEHPFQGRYIFLNFKESSFIVPNPPKFESGDKIFVRLEEDRNGFAIVSCISSERPANDGHYIEARVSYVSHTGNNGDSSEVNFNYPFDRFYLNEYKAPEAENRFRRSQMDTTKLTYALVRILDGKAVVKNLYINNEPIQ
jgi:uncharacterized membrane-anchored protein